MRLNRVGLLIAAAAAMSMAGSGGVLAQSDDDDVELTVVERATTDLVVDVGETGDSLGDMLAFGNDLYDESNSTVVGRDQGNCFRTNLGSSWECTFTNILEDGSITVQGPFYDDLRETEFAITGGTGAYAGAQGSMTLRSLDEGGTLLEFVFHVNLDDTDDTDDTDDADDADDIDDDADDTDDA